MLAGGASSSREAAPVLALFYIEGSASAWDLPRVSAVNWKAAFNMPVRKRMQISSFSLFWVRFMPPPHAQPPGSNKSQRGRECCKETDTLQFLCAGQGDGMCGDQQLLPGITNLVHTIPLLPSTTLETTHQNMGIYFLVIPFPPSCARVACAQSGMEPSTSSWQRGLSEMSPSPALCQSSLQHLMDPPEPQAWAALQT